MFLRHLGLFALCTIFGAIASASRQKCDASSGSDCTPKCADTAPNCANMVAAGECESAARRMWVECAASCGSCELITGGWETESQMMAEHCDWAEQTVKELQAAVDALPVKNGANIAQVLASSGGFRRNMWGRCPFVLRVDPALLPDFNLEAMLHLADGKLKATGSNSFMDPRVKAGKFHAFRLDYSGGGETIERNAVLKKMKDSSWLLSAIHTLHGDAGQLVLDFQHAFGLPGSANMYTTLPNFETAAARHTDRMDAFIVQTAGKKHWKVWAPKVLYPVWGVHENGQWGKGYTKMESNQMGPLLTDHVLKPGELLFVPRGFVHQTSTPEASEELTEASVALTVALSTEMYDMVYEKALQCVLWEAGICTEHPCRSAALVSAQARRDSTLRRSLPLGFLKKEKGEKAVHKDIWVAELALELVQLLEKSDADLSGSKLTAAQKAAAKLADILWETLERMMDSTGYKSFFAPHNTNPGACSDPRCQKRSPVPPDKKQDAIGRVLGFELRMIGQMCDRRKQQKPYMDMQAPAGGLIQTL